MSKFVVVKVDDSVDCKRYRPGIFLKDHQAIALGLLGRESRDEQIDLEEEGLEFLSKDENGFVELTDHFDEEIEQKELFHEASLIALGLKTGRAKVYGNTAAMIVTWTVK